MIRFLAKRLTQALVVLLLVSVLVFVLLHLLPGGPARAILGVQATPDAVAHFNHRQGYDRSLPEQYVTYLGRLLTGDLGESYKLNQSVASLLAERLPKTALLAGLALALAAVVAVPLGVLQAVRRGRAADYLLTGVAILAYATPVFSSAWSSSWSSASNSSCCRPKRRRPTPSAASSPRPPRSSCPS